MYTTKKKNYLRFTLFHKSQQIILVPAMTLPVLMESALQWTGGAIRKMTVVICQMKLIVHQVCTQYSLNYYYFLISQYMMY